jgi:hypothetical protein
MAGVAGQRGNALTVRAFAPAKLNLFLHVIGRRPDGERSEAISRLTSRPRFVRREIASLRSQ